MDPLLTVKEAAESIDVMDNEIGDTVIRLVRKGTIMKDWQNGKFIG